MAMHISTFLGANTPYGFVSFFDELYNPYKDGRMFIIKGGPGTGKSTLMKKLYSECERKGIATERVLCSSDPESLDGIIVSELNLAVADGTSPHTIEPKFPGASETIINTGDFWDSKQLYERREEIRALTLENSLYHRRSARYLSAAGTIQSESFKIANEYCDFSKIRSFAYRFCKRELPQKKGFVPGKKQRRFISAITPNGIIFKDDTVNSLATRIIGIADEYSCCSGQLLNMIGDTAVKNGYDCIFCHCPINPHSECEHLIIPEASLCLTTIKKEHKNNLLCDRIIHCTRFMDYVPRNLYSLKFNRKMSATLIDEAIAHLKSAKAVHDKLESIYVSAMDFDKLNEYTDKVIRQIMN